MITSSGQVIVGSSLSSTVTVNVQVSVLPASSVTVTVTVVVPASKLVFEPIFENSTSSPRVMKSKKV